MSREAMKLALEALEILTDGYDGTEVGVEIEAITALRHALDTEQEPVAWRSTSPDEKLFVGTSKEVNWTPIYTEPPKREWVGLTDEEMDELVNRFARYELAREIESKLKEKNGG
jgi:hypothetical protein